MGRKFTRRELYEFASSQPIKVLSVQPGISDVAGAKPCRKANITIPPRGYWTKRKVSKRVVQANLLPRFPGASDEIEIGVKSNLGRNWRQTIIDSPVPLVPTFDEDIDADWTAKVASESKGDCLNVVEPGVREHWSTLGIRILWTSCSSQRGAAEKDLALVGNAKTQEG